MDAQLPKLGICILELQDLGHLAKTLNCAPGRFSLRNEALNKVCIWKWKIWDTWPKPELCTWLPAPSKLSF